MNRLKFEDIKIRGDFAYRVLKNYSRLEGKQYKPENIFSPCLQGWPADWEGRTILALVLLARTSRREPAYLEEILRMLSEHLNEKGYMGKVLPESEFDEQQLSGHNWMLRGLMEYYIWKKDDKVLGMIQKIVRNLYLPARGYYRVYPARPEQRVFEGEAAGNLTGALVGNWYTSTDTGCAYMSLDALSQYYELFKDMEVKELLEEMIEMFMEIDFMTLSMQTHASLSATRGIIRFYEATGEKKYLEFAVKFFEFYTTQGMTENYANYNWFARPHWTEPCGIVDSYMVAVALFINTGNSDYLELAQKIYFNGFGYGQRPNGGFGCDTCAGAYDVFLSPKDQLYEAYWCCTMRGGEGLSRAAEDIVIIDENTIYITNLCSGEFSTGTNVISVSTSYPFKGNTEIKINGDCEGKVLKVFLPSVYKREKAVVMNNGQDMQFAADRGFICIPLKGEEMTSIDLSFDIELIKHPAANSNTIKGYDTYWHGVLMLGAKTSSEIYNCNIAELEHRGNGVYVDKGSSIEIAPINDMIDLELDESRKDMRQILFKSIA